ncbi:MAG: enoyl-CoA hydratase/isomerase family protein [Thermoplasmata archaeon]|nr:enoyl-CoA hydratase/isomerase family protein [Thermoplasmata archaeon]
MARAPRPSWVRYERSGGVAILTIDHPPVNVLSAEVLDDLIAALDRAEADPESHVVVLASAAEKAFAAGANIREMAPMGAAQARRHGGRGQLVTTRIEALPLPVIAAVHGVCLGGGCEIAMSCDFVLASDDAVFGQPEINLGVMPGWGGTQRLPLRIGRQAAREWIFTGRSYPADAAARAGLVLHVVPRSELRPAAIKFAEELAQKPATALAAAKRAIQAVDRSPLPDGLVEELSLWSRLFGTPDQKEGMQAFLEKRPWTPRSRRTWARDGQGFPWGKPRPRRGRKR